MTVGCLPVLLPTPVSRSHHHLCQHNQVLAAAALRLGITQTQAPPTACDHAAATTTEESRQVCVCVCVCVCVWRSTIIRTHSYKCKCSQARLVEMRAIKMEGGGGGGEEGCMKFI